MPRCEKRERKVALHAHARLEEFGRNVEWLLDTIPGLDRTATVVEIGYTCDVAGSARSPKLFSDDRKRLREGVCDTGAERSSRCTSLAIRHHLARVTSLAPKSSTLRI